MLPRENRFELLFQLRRPNDDTLAGGFIDHFLADPLAVSAEKSTFVSKTILAK